MILTVVVPLRNNGLICAGLLTPAVERLDVAGTQYRAGFWSAKYLGRPQLEFV